MFFLKVILCVFNILIHLLREIDRKRVQQSSGETINMSKTEKKNKLLFLKNRVAGKKYIRLDREKTRWPSAWGGGKKQKKSYFNFNIFFCLVL